MKRRVRRWIIGIMTASILSQLLNGTVCMAADSGTDSVSSASALVQVDSQSDRDADANGDNTTADGGDTNVISDDSDSSEQDSNAGNDNHSESANSGNEISQDSTDETSDQRECVASDAEAASGNRTESFNGTNSSDEANETISDGDAEVIDPSADVDGSDTGLEDTSIESNERGILEEDLSSEPYIFNYDSFSVEWRVVSHWEGACNVSVNLRNRSDETIHNWNLSFMSEDEIINPYNAKITSEGSDGNKWTIKNLEYNQDIRPGESIQFGFQVKYGERVDIPYSYSIDSSEKNVPSDSYEITNNIISSWDGGSVGEIRIANNTDTAIEDWLVTVRTKAVLVNVWGGTVEKVSENTYGFKCPDYAQNIAAGQTAVIGYQVSGSDTDIEILGLSEWTSSANKIDTNEEPSVSDNSVSGNIVSGNTVSDNSISENSISDNSVSENKPGYIESDGHQHIFIDSDEYELLDEGIYLLEVYSDSVTGYIDLEDEIESVDLQIQDLFEETVWEGDVISADGFKTWSIDDTGFVLGANRLIFEITFTNGTVMKEELIVINREASNIDNTYIELVDEDGDNIYDYYEKYFGTDPDRKDTDGDGLDDGAELFLLDTDPTDDDTDDDGIRDCDEDEDGDGLNILREHELRTSDLVDDYDLDKLNDGYEVNVTGTDPTLADTDFDGLMDIEELNLGLDPSKPDSDGNGIADRDELIPQEVSRDYSGTALKRVSVDMMCAGILDDKLYIYPTYDKNSIVYDTAGIIGDPVEIYCDADFDTADITFRYDETLLGDTKEEDLCMVWYDEANDAFVILEDSVVDTVNNTVTYTTTHFSTYLLVDKVKYKKTFEDKEIDLTKIKNLRDYYVFVVDFTASEESVDEQLRAVKEIMKYIDSVEPYSNYIDDDFNLRQYTYSIPKYILVYGKPGGAGDTYSDMASGYLDCHFNLENFDKIIQHYRDLGKVGTNMYDADFGNAAYKGVCFNGATFRHYFFMGDKYNLNDTWKSKIDSQFKNQTSLGVFNTVTLNNYGYNCFDSYVSEKGKIYRAINGTDAVIEEIIRDLKNSGVGKDLSGISHFSAIHSKLKYENDSYYLCFDGWVSAEDQEKQASVAQALIEHMDENDVVSIIAYYNDGYEMDYHLDKVDAIEWITRFKEREVATASKLYNGNIPVVLNSRVFNELARDTKSYADRNRNVKVFVFYAGNIYDSSIYEHLDKPYFSFDSKGINDSIKYAADNDVIINTIAISYPTSQYMDSLIPITGGKSYDDSKGGDMLIAEILNDLNEQKEIQKNKASEGSDQSKDISSEITVYLPNKFIGVEYLNVDGANGGNQNWWGTFSVYYEEDQDLLNYMVKRDLYDSADGYRTSEWGCGVMAMTDLELYLTQQNDGYHLMDQTFTYDTDSGNISQYEYMKCANYNRDNVYKLKPGLKNYIIGVTPFDMTDGIKKYLCENNSPYKNATWAPTNNKAGTIDKIETMISNGIPVVFSYYNTKVDLFMYPDSENAKMKTENIKFQRCDSHYMTIIGYTKYWDEVTNEYKYILKIESWGKIYYINYDKYAESLSYYSNILEIY